MLSVSFPWDLLKFPIRNCSSFLHWELQFFIPFHFTVFFATNISKAVQVKPSLVSVQSDRHLQSSKNESPRVGESPLWQHCYRGNTRRNTCIEHRAIIFIAGNRYFWFMDCCIVRIQTGPLFFEFIRLQLTKVRRFRSIVQNWIKNIVQ